MTDSERIAVLEQALAEALARIALFEAVIAHLSEDLAILEAKIAKAILTA